MKAGSRTRRIVGLTVTGMALAALAIPAARRGVGDLVAPRAGAEEASVALEAVLSDRKLHVAMSDGSVKTYDVAIGTARYPTPTGAFTIRRIVWNPGWVPPNSGWARGRRPTGPRDPSNPMKVAKIFFKQPDYYIHGTGHVESLGTAASHGCLRMHPDEVAELGAVVMRAGGVAHDWDWVKQTLRIGSTRTVNLKRPVRITIVQDRPEPVLDAGTDAVPSASGDSTTAPTDTTARPTEARDTAHAHTDSDVNPNP